VEYQGQLTLEDVLNGHRIYSHKRLVWWIHTLRWFGIGAAVGLTLALSEKPLPPLLIICYIILVLGIIARYFIVSRETKKHFAKQQILFLPFRSRIDDSGFETHYGKDSIYRDWSQFTGWIESEKYFVLKQSVGFCVVPKRVLSNADQVAQFRGLLKHIFEMLAHQPLKSRLRRDGTFGAH